MLLTERGDTLLPPCAFFLQCFLNTRGLRPTASREDFYEGRALSEAREEFAAAVRRHLARLAEEDPDRLRSIVSVHTEAIKAMADRFSLPFQPLHEEEMFDTLEEVTAAERQRGELLLRAADEALFPFECQAKLRRFLPADLPVLYAMSDEVQFLRQLQTAQENSNGIFSGALASMLSGVEERPLATLYLNLNSPIVRRLVTTTDPELLASMARVLYVQALLAGGHPLRGGELKTMNQALLDLLEHTAGA